MTTRRVLKTSGTVLFSTLLCLALFGLIGCSSNSNQESSSKSGLSSTYELQGVQFGVNPDWSIKPQNSACTYITIDDHNSHFSLQTVLHGQTKTLSSSWSEFYAGNDVPEQLKTWSDGNIDYIEGIVRKTSSTYLILAGSDRTSEKGFALSFVSSTKNMTESEEEELFDELVATLKYDSSKTTADYHEVYSSSKSSSASVNSTSSSSSASGSSSSSSASGSYLIGKDIPAGEYKLTTTSKGSCNIWSDAAKSNLLGARSFNVCDYVTLADGTVAEYHNTTFIPIDKATPTPPIAGSGVYKVGYDMPAGTYKISSNGRGAYMVYPDSSPQPEIVSAGSINNGSDYASVTDGQYIMIEATSIESQ